MIRGSTRMIDPRSKIIPLHYGIHNRFDVEVIDTVTGKTKLRAQGQNVICNNLWIKLFSPNSYFNAIHYGTGTGVPSASDTSLFTFLGSRTIIDGGDVISWPVEGEVYSLKRSIQLNESTAVDSNISEVGIAYGSEANTLCTHALLKDMNGNPISIHKTSTDIINIYATVFIHINKYGYNGVYILPESYVYKDRTKNYAGGFLGYLAGACSYNNPPNAVSSRPLYGCDLGMGGGCKDRMNEWLSITNTFDVANKKITSVSQRAAVDKYNQAGSLSLRFCTPWYSYVYGGYSPTVIQNPSIVCIVGEGWYPGTTISGESIGTGDGAKTDFSTSFPFVSNAKIYVNGVEDSSVTVSPGLCANNINPYPNYSPKAIIGARMMAIQPYSTVDHVIPSAGYYSGSAAGYDLAGNGTSYFYNPCYSDGLYSFYLCMGSIYCSDDLATWTLVGNVATTSASVTVSEEHQHKKFWKYVGLATDSYVRAWALPPTFTGNNIHFSTPPATGAVITADYFTKTIAKDQNHVFDVTLEMTFGEFTV